MDYACHDFCDGADPSDGAWVVGIDPATATTTFRVPLANWTFTDTVSDAAFCQDSSGDGTHVWKEHAWPNGDLKIAGDGAAYLSYFTYDDTSTERRAAAQPYPDAAYDLFDQLRQDTSNSNFSAALADLDALLAAMNDPTNGNATFVRNALTSSNRTAAIDSENTWAPAFTRACDTTESASRSCTCCGSVRTAPRRMSSSKTGRSTTR